MNVSCHVFVDFDGTIATVDTTDLLLERFAHPRWREIEQDWASGRIGSRECMARQIDLVRASREDVDRFVDDVAIDPDFPRFASLCRQLGYEITVVSDGLDYTIERLLARAGISLPVRANHFGWLGGDRWRLSFPHARDDCSTLAGNCKCQFAEAALGTARIVVGDGRSDFCIAGRADFVLAKSSLLSHCQRISAPHFAFTDFRDASERLLAWSKTRTASTAARRPSQSAAKHGRV
jgi:2,3-diketo-5-methylthio-1-phosphopentane phosphatase